MRVVINLNHPPQKADRRRPSSVVIELDREDAESQEPERDMQALQDRTGVSEDLIAEPGTPVSFFLGGPRDEHVRRDIPEGEHIVEDPAFDPLGFYGLVGIDRGGGPVVQWYRWMCNDEAEGPG
jgi:hypothetical protein